MEDRAETLGADSDGCVVDVIARQFVAGLGRTEDVAFSPAGRRLAVAAFARNSIGVVDFDRCGHPPRWVSSQVREFHSPELIRPHGLAFVDEDVLAVANRSGDVELFRLPDTGSSEAGSRIVRLDVTGGELSKVSSPGSVVVNRLPDQTLELIVCDNRRHQVTAHRITLSAGSAQVVADDVLVKSGLDVPDGAAVDGSCLAVSNHFHHIVLIYDRLRLHGGDDGPQAILRGSHYPHGLFFTPGGRFLLVADAGGAFVHLYERPGATWSGALFPKRSLRVTTDEAVASAPNREEGGPKGIAIAPDGQTFAVTGETVPFEIYDLEALVNGDIGTDFDSEMRFSYELAVLDSNDRRARRLAAATAAADKRLVRRVAHLRAWIRYQRRRRAM